MSSIQFNVLGRKPFVRFGNNPEGPQSQPAQAQPTPEQIQVWKDKVMNSPKIDWYIKSTLSVYDNPFPIPMLAELTSPNSSEAMRQQEIALTESGVRQLSRIGNIIGLQALTLESLAKLTEIPFLIRTEASR
jgi:hypothetical protein